MMIGKGSRFLPGLFLTVAVLLSVGAAGPQCDDDSNTRPGAGSGTRRLWRDPGNIARKNLYWGNTSPSRAPRPPFRFLAEDSKQSQPKIEVRDARGEKWKVKFGEEVHAEVAATRLVWAFGYFAEETYFVRRGKIVGLPPLDRAGRFISPDGTFRDARFERRPRNITRTDNHWSWGDNPFGGTRELSGLKILMTMINNWDTRSRSKNNTVLQVRKPDGRIECRYVVEDLGSSFGRMGRFPFLPRSRWNLADFRKQKMIDSVDAEELDLHYKGGGSINKVPFEHARWFSGLASQLNVRQVRQAFKASGANRFEVAGFSARMMEKIRELRAAVGKVRTPSDHARR
jgi:hypothetical protein